MPEANVLYSVTAAVIVGLVAWVALVLKTAKEPWARPPVASLRTEDVPVEGGAVVAPSEAKADAVAEAKDEAKAEAKDEAKAEAKDEAKAEAKADAEEKAEAEAEAKADAKVGDATK
jgi:flagellar biosynthesis/type III secretory pathway protein FliH